MSVVELEARLVHLRAALRPGEPLTEGGDLTPEGHIRSAITKLERQLERLRLKR